MFFMHAAWYISYPHMGKNGGNLHYHVLMPADSTKDFERIRKEIKTTDYTGNKQYSVKFMQNGLQSGIQDCSREKTQPVRSGIDCERWTEASPPWLNANLKDNLSDKKRSRANLQNGIKLTNKTKKIS